MKNKSIKTAKNEGHQDCDDCRRQRAQNQALISIYEKLQRIDQKTKSVKESVNFHRTQCFNNNNRFHDFSNKLQRVPKKSRATMQLQDLGNEIARQMVEQVRNGKVVKQNKRLKQMLVRMNKPKMYRSYVSDPQHQNQQIQKVKDQKSPRQKQIEEGKISKYFDRNSMQVQIKEEEEEGMEDQTQTTNFFSTKGNRSQFSKKSYYNKEKFDKLNLWLYETKKNVDLEQELYLTGGEKIVRKTTKLNKRYSSVLPALNTSRSRK